jgi:hypothetical protein
MTGVTVGRVWYAMSGLGTAAGAAKTVGPVGKKMDARIVMDNGLCVFMVKAIGGQGWSRQVEEDDELEGQEIMNV